MATRIVGTRTFVFGSELNATGFDECHLQGEAVGICIVRFGGVEITHTVEAEPEWPEPEEQDELEVQKDSNEPSGP